jgi:hypothetical protein
VDCGNNSCIFNDIQAITKLISPLLDGIPVGGLVSIAIVSSQTTGQLIKSFGNSGTRSGTIYNISNASQTNAHSIIIGNETTNNQTSNVMKHSYYNILYKYNIYYASRMYII